MSGGYYFWLGASAEPTGLGAPEGAEPPSRLGASPAIPRAVIDRFWAAILKHEQTIKMDALFDILKALGLRLTIVKKGGA